MPPPASIATTPPPSTHSLHSIQLFHHHRRHHHPFSLSPQPVRHLSLSLSPQPILFKTLLIHHHHHHHLHHYGSRVLLTPPHASVQESSNSRRDGSGTTFDPELRSVLELATDSELFELQNILFGTSYFSPLLKSIRKTSEMDYFMIGEDPQEREDFIEILESRFFFLAADARSTLRGWRPSYRDVLLSVRNKLKVHCSGKLSTEDLEVEIFLHLLQEFSSEEKGIYINSKESRKTSEAQNYLEHGLNQWKIQSETVGVPELRQTILKGGWMYTMGKAYDLLARRLSGKMFLEAAKYQIKNDVIKKGGQLAAINLEARAAVLAAKQGLAGAASRYIGLRSMIALLGPMMWGTFLAGMVIQMLGTDYARILRAIYAFAQIRVFRTYKLPSGTNEEEDQFFR